jgi:hypothetical protein
LTMPSIMARSCSSPSLGPGIWNAEADATSVAATTATDVRFMMMSVLEERVDVLVWRASDGMKSIDNVANIPNDDDDGERD